MPGEEILSFVLPAAKRFIEILSNSDDNDPTKVLRRIADNVVAIKESIDRLTKEVEKLPDIIVSASKYAIQLQAEARRESAAKALQLGIMDEALKALIDAERMEPVNYELWVLYIFYRCEAIRLSDLPLPKHSADQEFHKAITFTAADDSLRPAEKLALLYALLIAALWLREGASAVKILTRVNSILTERDVLTLANSPTLLAPFRQLASGELAPLLDGAERRLRACYEEGYRDVWNLIHGGGSIDDLKEFSVHAREALPATEINDLVYLEQLDQLVQQEQTIKLPSAVADPDAYSHSRTESASKIRFWMALLAVVLCPILLWRLFAVDSTVSIPGISNPTGFQVGLGIIAEILIALSVLNIARFLSVVVIVFICLFVIALIKDNGIEAVALTAAATSCTLAVMIVSRICYLLAALWQVTKAHTADIQTDLKTQAEREIQQGAALAELAIIKERKDDLFSLSDPARRLLKNRST